MTRPSVRFLGVSTAMLLAFLTAAPSESAAEDPWTPVSDRDRLLAEFYRILEEGDREALESLLAEDWEMYIALPPGQGQSNREEFLVIFDGGFASGNLDLVVNEVHWGGGENTAWCRVDEYHDWVTGEGKPRARTHILSTHVFEKRGNKWQLVHTHHSWIPDTEEKGEN